MISRRSADQLHVHHLRVQLVRHNTSVAHLLWFEPRVMAGFSRLLLIFSGQLLLRQTVRRYHVSVTHVFWMFSFSTSSHPFSHATCSCSRHVMFVPPRCIATLFRYFDTWFFFSFLQWKDALDIIILSSAGRNFPPLFS